MSYTLTELYKGYEPTYKTDAANTPVLLDNHTETASFSEYLTTSDYKTFTLLKDLHAFLWLGIRQAQSSSNVPNCSLFINGSSVYTLNAVSTVVNYKTLKYYQPVDFHTNDQFYIGSTNSKGYPSRLFQLFVLTGEFSPLPEPDYS